MKILIDSSLSPRIARALDALLTPERSVLHVNDLGGPGTTDGQILEFLKKAEDAAVIGMDLNILDNPQRIAALREWNRPVFLLCAEWLDLPPKEQSWELMSRMPFLLKKLVRGGPPAIHLVPAKSGVRIRKLA